MTDREQRQVYHKCQVKHGLRKKPTTGKIDITSGKTPKRHEVLS